MIFFSRSVQLRHDYHLLEGSVESVVGTEYSPGPAIVTAAIFTS